MFHDVKFCKFDENCQILQCLRCLYCSKRYGNRTKFHCKLDCIFSFEFTDTATNLRHVEASVDIRRSRTLFASSEREWTS